MCIRVENSMGKNSMRMEYIQKRRDYVGCVYVREKILQVENSMRRERL